MSVPSHVFISGRAHTDVSRTRAHTQVLLQVLNFVSVLASGLMIWKGLGLITNTESPIVVVLRYVFALPALPCPCGLEMRK